MKFIALHQNIMSLLQRVPWLKSILLPTLLIILWNSMSAQTYHALSANEWVVKTVKWVDEDKKLPQIPTLEEILEIKEVLKYTDRDIDPSTGKDNGRWLTRIAATSKIYQTLKTLLNVYKIWSGNDTIPFQDINDFKPWNVYVKYSWLAYNNGNSINTANCLLSEDSSWNFTFFKLNEWVYVPTIDSKISKAGMKARELMSDNPAFSKQVKRYRKYIKDLEDSGTSFDWNRLTSKIYVNWHDTLPTLDPVASVPDIESPSPTPLTISDPAPIEPPLEDQEKGVPLPLYKDQEFEPDTLPWYETWTLYTLKHTSQEVVYHAFWRINGEIIVLTFAIDLEWNTWYYETAATIHMTDRCSVQWELIEHSDDLVAAKEKYKKLLGTRVLLKWPRELDDASHEWKPKKR